MDAAPLGICKRISPSEHDKYFIHCIKMLDKAAEDEGSYEYWSQWCLWYYDIILFSFFGVERPQMYAALDAALLNKDMIEADRLIRMCIKI